MKSFRSWKLFSSWHQSLKASLVSGYNIWPKSRRVCPRLQLSRRQRRYWMLVFLPPPSFSWLLTSNLAQVGGYLLFNYCNAHHSREGQFYWLSISSFPFFQRLLIYANASCYLELDSGFSNFCSNLTNVARPLVCGAAACKKFLP